MAKRSLHYVAGFFTRRKLPYSYPRGVLTHDGSRGWRMTPVIIHLLCAVTGADKTALERTRILKRNFLHPVPWFRTSRGGGAIVLGTSARPRIIFTENFFLREIYGRRARHYGNRLDVWLDMLSHEVGHVGQLQRMANPATYIASFAWQYLRAVSHSNAPLEKEAEEGRKRYRKFIASMRNEGLIREFYNLLRSDQPEDDKICQMDLWLKRFS
ncbi:MAG: hypothetical protein WBB45_00290 [Cyclobacteriaceae bacterium]